MTLVEEAQVVGAYRVLEQVGAGGMGTVWVAEHTMLGRRAAIKLLHPEYSSRAEIVMRFFNEAKAAAAINDPGIVQIFDFGKHTDGRVYIIMELLEGEGLDRRLHRLRSLAVMDALRIVRQVASSLGAAHSRGIIHRDLKPENIFLAYDPEVPGGERAKILDFGIAKLAREQGTVKTNTSTLLGTPTYMSPEQCRGAGQVDQRSDVYSLGCVLFTLITGEPPFVGEGAGDVIVMQMTQPAPLASSRISGVPYAVDQLIARCLAKNAAERFDSGGALAAAISSVLGHTTGPHRPDTATARTHEGPIAMPAVTTLTATSGALQAAAPRRSKALLAGGIGGAVAIVIGVVVATRAPSKDPEVAVVSPVVKSPSGEPPVAPSPVTPPSPPVTSPVTVPPAKPRDLGAETTQRITAIATTFRTWSASHAGVACPSLQDLGGGDDAWAHPLVVTCTEQPADQIIGIRSAGADGTPGTADDLASWKIPAIATVIHGEHWRVASVAVKPPRTGKPPKPPVVGKPPVTRPPVVGKPPIVGKPPATAGDIDGDGIPDTR